MTPFARLVLGVAVGALAFGVAAFVVVGGVPIPAPGAAAAGSTTPATPTVTPAPVPTVEPTPTPELQGYVDTTSTGLDGRISEPLDTPNTSVVVGAGGKTTGGSG